MSNEQPVTILFKGGRLASWHQLAAEQKRSFEQTHVDLMLRTAKQHQLRRIEGYRLIAPQGDWAYFWVIEFPALSGVEAWIEAEMAPPYGHYGFFDYQLARQIEPSGDTDWLPHSKPEPAALQGNPHHIPELEADQNSIVVIMFERDQPGFNSAENTTPTLASKAKSQRVSWMESYRLIAPRASGDRVWLVEFPELNSAETWIKTEAAAGRADNTERHFHLTRKWAPSYFANWIP